MKNGQLQHLNPWQKVSMFFLIMFLGLTIASLINHILGSFLLNSDEPFEIMNDLTRIDGIRMMKIGNLIVHLVAFIAPVIFLAKAFNFDPKEAIRFQRPEKNYWIWLPFAFIFLTLINDGLYAINHQIDFSVISGDLQKTFEYRQAIQEKTIYAYIGSTWKSYYSNLFLIALIPAISEELLFRGLIQNLFSKATQNIWTGILISAFLFALIHIQPFNFLPMFALAFCYGMITAFTGSIWITMALHFLNNALTISLEHFQRMFGWSEVIIPDLISISLILTSFVAIIIVIRSKKLPSKWNETKGIYLR
ncbi:MAG: CPBP family intramembrane metalloprotease [Flavobacteriales bacterium]|nr:CPBP family intramembrane metalloprotease [Flavobacteriales bacterium]